MQHIEASGGQAAESLSLPERVDSDRLAALEIQAAWAAQLLPRYPQLVEPPVSAYTQPDQPPAYDPSAYAIPGTAASPLQPAA